MRSLLLIAVAAVLGSASPAAGDEDPLIAEIRKAWQERHDRFQSFEIEWVQQETTPRGTLDQGVPAADVVHNISCRLVGAGENFYYHRKGQQFDIQRRKFVENEYVSVLNGSERRYLFQGENYGRLRCFRLRGQSILLFLDGQLTFELRWGDVPQRGMAA